MKLKIALATATALGLCMGTAWAGNGNDSDIRQSGSNNSASIDQSGGSNNDAGTVAYPSSPNFKLWQLGNGNALNITQTGRANQIGVNTSAVHVTRGYTDSNGMSHAGFNGLQDGNNNVATINQDGGPSLEGNQIGGFFQVDNNNELNVTQGGTSSSSGSAQNLIGQTFQTGGGNTNTLTLTQTSDNSYVGPENPVYVHDGYRSGNTVGFAEQDGSGNTGAVSQSGNRNYVATFSQIGNSNTANVTEDGVGNRVDSLSQSTNGNMATVSLNGNYNGANSGALEHVEGGVYGYVYGTASFSGVAGDVASVTQGEIQQTGGSGNQLAYTATGSYNLFGFTQDGAGNWISGTADGDNHQVAIWQHGDGNIADFVQTGAGNNAGLSMDGNNNILNVRQDQSGASGNKMSVSITGNKNNNYALTGNALAGDALTVRNVVRADLGSTAFGQGDLFQDGSNNGLTLTVASNRNAFATYQSGNNNSITGSISGGNSNQAVVAQIGNGNVTAFTQTGGGNNVGISQ